MDKKDLRSVYKILKNRNHTDIYLVPSLSKNNVSPYFICDSDGSVLFVSYIEGKWEEIDNIGKQSLNSSTLLTDENTFMYSTLI